MGSQSIGLGMVDAGRVALVTVRRAIGSLLAAATIPTATITLATASGNIGAPLPSIRTTRAQCCDVCSAGGRRRCQLRWNFGSPRSHLGASHRNVDDTSTGLCRVNQRHSLFRFDFL